jgi:septum site-determining protein MinC
MLSIGLTGGSADVELLSTALNLPILSAFRAASNPFPAAVPPTAPTPTEATTVAAAEPATAAPAEAGGGLAALIHSQTVRSGQRIYARDRDLVITSGVGAGAEVMADGCVHIYGSLRGRAMAGVHGQLSARVFCHEFNAELVSIAGVFRVFETIPPELIGKPVQAWLDGEDLRFAVVGN